jgi:SAM-dependent methyltransferase
VNWRADGEHVSVALWLLVVLLLAVLLYWLVVVGEGTYLGRPAVRLIYQLGAGVYDQARGKVTASDQDILLPVLREALAGASAPRVLDVATGTARAPLLLASQPWFDGAIEGLDLTPAMLERARAKIAAAGLGVAALAGVLTSTIGSHEKRPEDTVGVTDHVPGQAIAGARSSVNPKRRMLPAEQGVRTTVVSPMRQAVDLEVRAKSADRGAQHEVAKMVEQMAAGNGYTNVTVNRVGGWRDAASKIRLREQIRDDLRRY